MPKASESLANLSASMADLSKRAKEAEDRTADVRRQNEEQLQACAAEVRAAAERRRQEARDEGAAAKEEMDSSFAKLRAQVQDHLEKMHAKMGDRRGDMDAKVAEQKAEWAELRAADVVDFAYDAVIQAEYAVLEAAAATRATSDAKASSQKAG